MSAANRTALRGNYISYFEGVNNDALTLEYIHNYLTTQHNHNGNPFRSVTDQYTQYQDMLVAAESARKKKKYSSIEEVKVVVRPSKRRLSQPILKPVYETWHDIEMRLKGTMIFVGSDPFQVMETIPDGKDYTLIVTDKTGKKGKVPYYACEHIDVRSPEPQYFLYNSQPAFLRRPPFRQQQQGFSYGNSSCNYVGQDRTWRADNIPEVMVGLNTDPFPWNTGYQQIMKAQVRSLRLSKDIAVYLSAKGKGLVAEYKGRDLGPINENEITVDEHDYGKPWIRQAVESVSMRLRQ